MGCRMAQIAVGPGRKRTFARYDLVGETLLAEGLGLIEIEVGSARKTMRAARGVAGQTCDWEEAEEPYTHVNRFW